MTMDEPDRWAHEDPAARRLLEALAAPDLDYYSAAHERAVAEALEAWPLLATVAHRLTARAGGAAGDAGPPGGALGDGDPILRVVSSDAAAAPGEALDPDDAPAGEPARRKET